MTSRACLYTKICNSHLKDEGFLPHREQSSVKCKKIFPVQRSKYVKYGMLELFPQVENTLVLDKPTFCGAGGRCVQRWPLRADKSEPRPHPAFHRSEKPCQPG